MHTDVATGQVRAELQDSVKALDQLVSELQELNRKLREQWPKPQKRFRLTQPQLFLFSAPFYLMLK